MSVPPYILIVPATGLIVRQYRPIPPEMKLAETLARRVVQLREFRNLTVKDLGKLTRFGLERVEDIEAGLETWLSVADRQVLAKALGVEPVLLADVESRPRLNEEDFRAKEHELARKILEGARDLECPRCGGTMNCRVEQAFDIEGKAIQMAKAFCLKCSFVVR